MNDYFYSLQWLLGDAYWVNRLVPPGWALLPLLDLLEDENNL